MAAGSSRPKNGHAPVFVQSRAGDFIYADCIEYAERLVRENRLARQLRITHDAQDMGLSSVPYGQRVDRLHYGSVWIFNSKVNA